MEQLYTLKRQGNRLIFEEWNGERRERKTKPALTKNVILELLKRIHPMGYGARDVALELSGSKATVHRHLKKLKAEKLIEVAHKQHGFRCRPFDVYRAVIG